MRLLVLEDEPHWQATISSIVVADPSLSIVKMCANLSDALAAIKALEFEMFIVDLGLPDGNGVDAIRTSRRLRPDADILVATVFDDEKSVVSAICAGATGYLVKDSTAQEWAAAIKDLRAGHSPLSPKIARHILRRLQEPSRARRMGLADDDKPSSGVSVSTRDENVSLSAREIEVLRLVAKGFSLVEVAQLLHVSHTTTRSHAKNIYRKLEVNSRGEAVFEATRLGLL
jgi:DNA-binding NarL/FixJ family response regulator